MYQSTRSNPATEPRKASSSRKEDPTKSSHRDPNKLYGNSSSNDDTSDDSSSGNRGSTHASAHPRRVPPPAGKAPRKSSGAADEPRFADAAYSRLAGRSGGYPGQQPSAAQRRTSRSQRYPDPSPSARSRDHRQHAKQARYDDSRDYLDDVAEDMDELDLELPRPARAAFTRGRTLDRYESARASRGPRDEREVREGYRYVRRPVPSGRR